MGEKFVVVRADVLPEVILKVIEAKKMIVSCLIKRIDVYRDYKLHLDFNIDFEQFSAGLDIVTIAA